MRKSRFKDRKGKANEPFALGLDRRLAFDMDESCRIVNLGRSMLYGEIRAGRLKTFKIGKKRLATGEALRAYIQAREAESASAAA